MRLKSMDKNEYLKEIKNGMKIAEKMRGGYSAYGDRSRHIIKLCKDLETNEDVENFAEALSEFLKDGKKEKINFLTSIIIDSIAFGHLIE
jgi:hypothetical protein